MPRERIKWVCDRNWERGTISGGPFSKGRQRASSEENETERVNQAVGAVCARALRQERAGRAGEPEGESLDSALGSSSPISQACAH